MSEPVFEAKPRFRGAPLVCVASGFMGFDSPKHYSRFCDEHSPGGKVFDSWLCAKCDKWHFYGSNGDPAGGSSGTTRSAKRAEFYHDNPDELAKVVKPFKFVKAVPKMVKQTKSEDLW